MFRSVRFALLLIFVISFWNPVAVSAPSFSIVSPCSPDSPAPVPSFMQKCSALLPKLASELDSRVKTQTEIMYREGKSVDPTEGADFGQIKNLGASGGSESAGYRFVKPVCNVAHGEVTSNHISESCGDPMYIHAQVDGSALVHLTWDVTGGKGSLESAYYGGSFVQALACYTAQVKQEVLQKRALRVSPACANLGRDVESLGRKTNKVTEGIRSQLANQANISDIWNCKNNWDTSGNNTSIDAGPLRQSAQQLCAARSGIESAFNQLMVCEVFARAGKDFRSIFDQLDNFHLAIQHGPGMKCRKACRDQCGSCGSTGSCSSCATRCANQCYAPELAQFIRTKLNRWPSDGSCPYPN